ncbi:MAG: ATP-binding protein [Chloroflexota bacterium]|nr:ATP-binding protein [Dehalococcoidia bacterium]MDW8252781.1 ATP-binding protein [Chloroflexota bacterium]
MSLRLRLALTYSILMVITIAVLGVTILATAAQSLGAEMDRRLEVRAEQVRLTILPRGIVLTSSDLAYLDLRPLSSIDAPGIFVQVMDPTGAVVAASETLNEKHLSVDNAAFQAALMGRTALAENYVGGRPIRILTAPIRSSGATGPVIGVMVVGQSREPLFELIENLRTLLITLGAGAVLVSGAVGWFVALQGLSPLKAFAHQAAMIAAGRDFSQRLKPSTQSDEVGELARTINHLLLTVEDTLRMHREFVADTSHELRNPLLALRTNLELLDRVSDPADRAECIREARHQVERLSRLVTDLLVLARVEAGLVVERNRVKLDELLTRVVREAERHAQGQLLSLEVSEPIEVLGDEGRLAQVVANLLDNAIKFTPAGGRIDVRLDRLGDRARITVADTGEGIPAEHLPNIWKRFYRVHKAGPRATAGAGLGLSIVKYLVEAHGGEVSCQSELGRGTTFSILLPIDGAPAKPPLLLPAMAETPAVLQSARG